MIKRTIKTRFENSAEIAQWTNKQVVNASTKGRPNPKEGESPGSQRQNPAKLLLTQPITKKQRANQNLVNAPQT